MLKKKSNLREQKKIQLNVYQMSLARERFSKLKNEGTDHSAADQ